MRFLTTCFATLLFISLSYAQNKHIYIDAQTGNDEFTGETPEKAWLSFNKLNQTKLMAGDTVSLNGKFITGQEIKSVPFVNSDFELGNLLPGWIDWGQASIDLLSPNMGKYCLKITRKSTGGGVGYNLTNILEKGKTYKISARCKLSSSTTTWTGIGIDCQNAGVKIDSASTQITHSKYTTYSFFITIPLVTDYVQFWAWHQATACDFFMDDVEITEITSGIRLDNADSGIAGKPFVIKSYSETPATIYSLFSYGLLANSAENFVISNLAFIVPDSITNRSYTDGIYIINNDNKTKSNITLKNLEVAHFGRDGIRFRCGSKTSGFRNVWVENVKIHDNLRDGFLFLGFWENNQIGWQNHNITLRNVDSYNNTGDPNYHGTSTGSGIIVSHADSVLIEFCTADNNGFLSGTNPNQGANCGIWTYHCNAAVIQYCIARNTKNGTANLDGNGFDIDGGGTNCIIQYCYSYNNIGAGYLFAQFDGARKMSNNTIRYCISLNDGQEGTMGGIHFWCGNNVNAMKNSYVYNNTIISEKTTPLKFQTSSPIDSVLIANNIFVTGSDKKNIIIETKPSNLVLAGNCWFSKNNNYQYNYNGKNYNSLDAFRTATGFEKFNNTNSGIQTDPLLKNTWFISPLTLVSQLDTLDSYSLLPSSPLINAGINLFSELGIETGSTDLVGKTLPIHSKYDIGAIEYNGELTNVKQLTDENQILCYFPTPDVLFLKNIKQYHSLKIVNLSGQIFQKENIHVNEKYLNVNHLQTGVFLVVLENDESRISVKILKR